MKKAFAFVISLSFLVLVLSACNNNVDDMLEDYNGGFEKGYTVIQKDAEEEEPVLGPGDEGFHQEDMLRDEYFLGWDSTLNLYVPPKSQAPQWWITDPDGENTDAKLTFLAFGKTSGDSVWTQDYFCIYAPDSLLESGHTYTLTLTVKDKEGHAYTDKAALVVYRHIDPTNL